jgi:hypothetical protein
MTRSSKAIGNAHRSLLAFDPSCQSGNRQSQRNNDHVPVQLIGEGYALVAVCDCSSSIYAVRQFDYADGGKGALRLSVHGLNTLDNLFYCLSPPFPCDEHAGVED